jgi:hypothetical protein
MTLFIFKVSFLNLVKTMILGSSSAEQAHLSPSFLFVMLSVSTCWRVPEHRAQMLELIETVSALRISPSQLFSCAMTSLTLPLILAGIAGARAFGELLPPNFFAHQPGNQLDCPYNPVSLLKDYYESKTPTLDPAILGSSWCLTNEYIVGYQGFDAQRLSSALAKYLADPMTWSHHVSLLFYKGSKHEALFCSRGQAR